jgi:parallel beta-helix repeat protein
MQQYYNGNERYITYNANHINKSWVVFTMEMGKMQRIRFLLLVVTVLVFCMNSSCVPVSSPSTIPITSTLTPVLPRPTSQEKTIVVASLADSGHGTLRQALQDAQAGDIIIFDPVVFPPDSRTPIYVNSILPPISQGNITVDASDTGVILDGSKIPEGWNGGIQIYSNNNTIRGLQVLGFSGAGILIGSGQNNLIENNVSCGNDYGIGLWGTETFGNTISDNDLGVLGDGATSLGNKTAGITIMEGANRNIIGPGNQIAFNGRTGIEILNANTVRNTISQNSIHDNSQGGIHLWDGGNIELTAPIIFDFDLRAGAVTGTACAGCTIEIYSDRSDEGTKFEGQTTADSNGAFAFKKGAPFAGPYLTATATDKDGNASQFSTPTFGASRFLILQEGNDLLRTWLETRQSSELEDNRLGSVGMSDMADPFGQPHDLQSTMEKVVSMGLQQFRFTIVNIDGTLVDWNKPEFTFEPRQKDFITGLDENGVKVTYLLIFRDDELGGEGRSLRPRFKTEEEIQRYLDYVRFIISNVKGHVTYYEIWNEPNIADSVQWIEAEDYIKLVQRIVPVIRQEDPQAKIVLAGTTYLREPGSRDYTFSLLRSDVMPLVDVISWHPMYATSPEFDSEYYYEYPSIIQQIKDTASAHGFTGEYHAGELTWWTEPEPGAKEWGIWYSDIVAAKYHARSTVMHLGMDISVTNNTTPSSFLSRRFADAAITNLCTIMAGAETASLPVEIETAATNIMSYGFSLSNGDYLFALWTDGAAIDDDPGVIATLTFPSFSAGEVVGIDALYGFEQQIKANMEDGNLVVHNLFVKDYPIILHFKHVQY